MRPSFRRFFHTLWIGTDSLKLMVMLCNAEECWKPRQAGPHSRFCVGSDSDWLSPDMNGSENENTACSRFSQP